MPTSTEDTAASIFDEGAVGNVYLPTPVGLWLMLNLHPRKRRRTHPRKRRRRKDICWVLKVDLLLRQWIMKELWVFLYILFVTENLLFKSCSGVFVFQSVWCFMFCQLQ